MTKRKHQKAVRRTKQSSRKQRTAAKRSIETRSTPMRGREIQGRLQQLEAKVTALTLAVRYVAARALIDSKNPIGELQRQRRKALETIGYIDSLEEAMWVDELMRFYDAVIGSFSKRKTR